MDKLKYKNMTQVTTMNVLNTWAKHKKVLKIEKVKLRKLDKILQYFFMKQKKQDGQDYETVFIFRGINCQQ